MSSLSKRIRSLFALLGLMPSPRGGTVDRQPQGREARYLPGILSAIGDPLGNAELKDEARRNLGAVFRVWPSDERRLFFEEFAIRFEQNLGSSTPDSALVVCVWEAEIVIAVFSAHGCKRALVSSEIGALMDRFDYRKVMNLDEVKSTGLPLGAVLFLSFFKGRTGEISMYFTQAPSGIFEGGGVVPDGSQFDAIVVHPDVVHELESRAT